MPCIFVKFNFSANGRHYNNYELFDSFTVLAFSKVIFKMNSNYSQVELVNMIYAIGESNGNCFMASRLYAQKFPEARRPNERSLIKLKDRFERTGSVAYEKTSRTKTVLNEDNQLAIALTVVENPEISVRKISTNLEMKKSSVNNCLLAQKFHPYQVQLHQELSDNDFERRMLFCQWAQNTTAEDEDFFKYVMFTDESTFHRNGFVNRHNFHFYDTQNPHALLVNNFQHQWSLNVWGGVIHDYVIGPYFFDEHLNGRLFLEFLRHDFVRLTDNLPEFITNRMWLQLDGAPPHYSRYVREHLNEQFPERWIGRNGW